MMKIIISFCFVILYSGKVYSIGLEELFKWKEITFNNIPLNEHQLSDFAFPTEQELEQLENNSSQIYIPYNNVPMGVSHHNGKLFVTVPRRRHGIPSTLNYINLQNMRGTQSPPFKPYPNYAYNELDPTHTPNPERIISVYRTRVDKCNRLWFIDTGLLEYPNNRIQVQMPSIWVMDLATNQRIRRFEIPQTTVTIGNGLASITVDVDEQSCDSAFAYIPDLANYRLYVYSFEENRIWSFRHNYFSYDPRYGDFNVGGIEFQWDDGIFSITLGRKNPDGFRTAYFHAMCSISEFTVSTEVLRNSSFAERSHQGSDFKYLGSRGENSQTAMHDFHSKSGILFYAEVGRNSIGCWNSQKPFTPENHDIVAKYDEKMIYPGDMSVDANGTIWVMSNTMPQFIYARLHSDNYNFRIWRQTVQKAIAGTRCEIKN